jgi:hypothetical protein
MEALKSVRIERRIIKGYRTAHSQYLHELFAKKHATVNL